MGKQNIKRAAVMLFPHSKECKAIRESGFSWNNIRPVLVNCDDNGKLIGYDEIKKENYGEPWYLFTCPDENCQGQKVVSRNIVTLNVHMSLPPVIMITPVSKK